MLDSKFTTLKCTLLNMTNDIGRVVFESDDGIIIRDVNLDRLNKEKTIEVDVKNINKLKMTITGQNVRIAEPQLFNKFETKEGNDISLNTLREFKERVSLNNVDSNLDYMVFSKDSNYFEIANEKYKFGIIHGGSSSTHMSEFMLDQKFSRFEATVWSNSSKGKIEILDGDKTLIKTVLLSENNASQKISVDTKGLKNMFIRIYEQETIIAEPMLIQ